MFKPNYKPMVDATTKTLIVYLNCGMFSINDYELGRDLISSSGSPFFSDKQMDKTLDAYKSRGYNVTIAF